MEERRKGREVTVCGEKNSGEKYIAGVSLSRVPSRARFQIMIQGTVVI